MYGDSVTIVIIIAEMVVIAIPMEVKMAHLLVNLYNNPLGVSL